MAKIFTGGTQVGRGYYINARSFEFANIAKDGMPLPGGPGAKFLYIPTVLAMVAAPAIGGLFVIALPFLGFGMVGYALLKRLGSGAREVAVTVATPSMPVGSTALTGRPSEKEPSGDKPVDPKIEELAKEIEEKRAQK